jgi:hypothetical protein
MIPENNPLALASTPVQAQEMTPAPATHHERQHDDITATLKR